MNKQITLQRLIQIGLEEIEAQIYLHLLENGPKTPLILSRETNIDRSKIYRYIEKLIKKNLLLESNDTWGKKIQATSPTSIKLLIHQKEELLQSQKESLPSLINQLTKIPTYAKREFEVKHYRGQDGLRQMLWNQLNAKNEILAFSHKNRNDMVGKPYAEKIRNEQISRKITLYEVENETDQGDYWYTSAIDWDKFYRSRYISPKILKIRQYIAVFNNTVAIINWLDGEEIGLEITNSTYADMQRQLFWKFWKIAKKNK